MLSTVLTYSEAGEADEGRWRWRGEVSVVVRDVRTGRFLPGTRRFHNLITDAGGNFMRDVLGGFVTDGKLKYIAVGTSSTAPAVGQTALGAESFRKLVTSYDNVSVARQVKTILYLSPSEANVAIAEIGFFAGASAGAGSGSGVMIARVLYSHTKTAGESITITRTDTF